MQQVDLWYLSRATGIVALVLLTATTFLGVLVAGRAKSKLPSFARADAHRYISTVTVAFASLTDLPASRQEVPLMSAEPVSGPDPDCTQAFDELVHVVDRYLGQGRVPRSAAVKTALQANTDPPFDERKLGFPTFRAFLKAAEDAGCVQLLKAENGPDVDVTLPGRKLPPRTPRWLRRDVWEAFTRWDDRLLRFWDRNEQRACQVPAERTRGEIADVTVFRDLARQEPARFVEIKYIPQHEVVAWAKDFVGALQPGDETSQLLATLEQEAPLGGFTALSRRLGIAPKWNAFHTDRVRGAVEEWAKANEVDLYAVLQEVPPPNPQRTPGYRRTTAQGPASLDEETLRGRLHHMVDRMTLPELLSVSVPLRLIATP